ncbi:MAG: hypothetical protein IPM47_07965 [Sphingobacteriales bacterium]|nr:MAG: hypothetical protein IPM47_07965 [Sphingobacteriales bacterium]
MKRKKTKKTAPELETPKAEEKNPDSQNKEEDTNTNEIDPEYLEILMSYTEEDLEAMDMDPDEAENRYTGYEMEE